MFRNPRQSSPLFTATSGDSAYTLRGTFLPSLILINEKVDSMNFLNRHLCVLLFLRSPEIFMFSFQGLYDVLCKNTQLALPMLDMLSTQVGR